MEVWILAQRKRVEAAITEGELRAVVCTGTLDLGIDWNEVDLVMQVGAPKNIKDLCRELGGQTILTILPPKP